MLITIIPLPGLVLLKALEFDTYAEKEQWFLY